MKVHCVVHLKYGHKIEQWFENHAAAVAHIEVLKSKGVEIIKSDITEPIPEDVSNLH